jgi:hypothetical protein
MHTHTQRWRRSTAAQQPAHMPRPQPPRQRHNARQAHTWSRRPPPPPRRTRCRRPSSCRRRLPPSRRARHAPLAPRRLVSAARRAGACSRVAAARGLCRLLLRVTPGDEEGRCFSFLPSTSCRLRAPPPPLYRTNLWRALLARSVPDPLSSAERFSAREPFQATRRACAPRGGTWPQGRLSGCSACAEMALLLCAPPRCCHAALLSAPRPATALLPGACSASRVGAARRPASRSGAALAPRRGARAPRAAASHDGDADKQPAPARPLLDRLGLSLGPIGMTLGGAAASEGPSGAEAAASSAPPHSDGASSVGSRLAEAAGVSLGPIALSLGESARVTRPLGGGDAEEETAAAAAAAEAVRLNSLSSEEWRRTFVRPGARVRACAPLPRTHAATQPRTRTATHTPRHAARRQHARSPCRPPRCVPACVRACVQTTPSTCGLRTTSTRRRACRPGAPTARAKTWPGPARRRPTRTCRCTASASSAAPPAGARRRATPAAPTRAKGFGSRARLLTRVAARRRAPQVSRQRRGVHRARG